MPGAVILMEFRFRAELPGPDNSKFDLTTTASFWHALIGFCLIYFCPFFRALYTYMNTQLMTAAFLLSCLVSAAATEDKVLADFENGSYEPWTVTGEAFGASPASGPLPAGSSAVRPGRMTSKVAARRWRRSRGRWASLLE